MSETRESENKIKERKKILKKTKLPFGPFEIPFWLLMFCFVFFLYVGPTCPIIPLLGPFQPRNNLFCPGFNFIYHN